MLLALLLPGPPPTRQAAAPAAAPPAYLNPRLAVRDRVADLLRRMTLEEKLDQLAPDRGEGGLLDTTGTFSPDQFGAAMRRMNDMAHPYDPRTATILRNAVQRYRREKTRLGIPTLFFGEALHGFMAPGATMFPMPIGLASTWDPALALRIYTAAGNEAAAEGVNQVFAPDLDLGREPRWGRTEETFGEDPYLVSRMGLAEVEGLQGTTFLIPRDHVLATAKHFAAHGQPEGGTNAGAVNISERILRANFFYPFRVAVEQGHVGSVMASYNEIDGIPSSVNRWLLERVLHQEWGFDGYITSDGGGLEDLVNRHHTAADFAGAARLALAAGVDYDLSNGAVYHTLLAQVRSGAIPESAIDAAAGRVLAAKFRLGLFDHPYEDPDRAGAILGSPAHRQLALEAARESLVLLKNDGLLPLDPSRYPTIAVIGPDAAYAHLGGYSRQPAHEVSVLAGIRARATGKARVLYAEGCKITTDITAQTPSWLAWYKNGFGLPDPNEQRREIAAAVETAKQAQLVILVIGENESIDREAWSLQHLGDRDSLDLFGDQGTLARAILATGVPTAVVLINGRPISTNFLAAHAPAMLEAWYPGQEGGTAVAEALFGDINPSGKLPITIPHGVGQLPDYYDHSPSENIPWIGTDRKPLYPFGYGLSYTTFRFSGLSLAAAEIGPGDPVTVRFTVANTGARAGTEVAEVYIHERASLVAQPVEQLRGFTRVSLQPGESRQVEVTLPAGALAQWDVNMHRVVEPGVYDVMVGGSSDDVLATPLTVVAR
ncbi:MAG: glycoside hydrolase family 3 N-terminal domain-containing protein [Terriglobales bacterium]